MNTKLKIVLLVLFLIQFLKPTLNENEYDAKTDFLATEKPSEAIAKQFKASCYNCHSSKTVYPWYNTITPINFWLNNHIKEAKSHIDFSNWTKYSTKNKLHALEECIEELEEHEMPLKSYVWLHEEAKLSDQNRKEMITWLKQLQIKYELIPPPM